jgi:predicted enzyme related to lactoylglutathione lyase
MSLFKGINVVSVCVPDLQGARDFYCNTLQLGEPIYDLPEAGWIEFRTGSVAGNIAITKAQDDWTPSTSTTIVFNVADCDLAREELRRRGVQCDEPVVFPGFVTFCSFYDPFGNRLQMCSPAPE